MNATSASKTGAATTIGPRALKLNEACSYLGGLSERTVHRLVERGLLTPNRATRILLFPIAELDRFLAAK